MHASYPLNRFVVSAYRNFVVIMAPRELLDTVTRRLADAGVPAAEYAARFLVTEILGCSAAELFSATTGAVPDAAAERIFDAADQCTRRMPVQYAIGYAYFRDLRLRVTPDVMIPRPETEQLVDLVLSRIRHLYAPRVLDIGTGSGCIALSIRKEHPQAQVTGCDISQAALEVAKVNAESQGLEVKFVEADVLAVEDGTWRSFRGFDVVVSNPPYIPDQERIALQPEVRDHEPVVALYCGADPLKFYRAIADIVQAGALRPAGLIALETHADYASQVAGLFEGVGHVEIREDYAGLSRFVLVRYP
ncbi:MAG: peptide chain release factor N(5)-glutamine methyltransferase [Bacteroidota bacterium]|nr:peptide chain release factor N(5)-glutamine methyltransferase [Bacteroidota bacterium]